jgi:hypothetical protein
VEHGVLLEALVHLVAGGAQPHGVHLGVHVAELQGLLQVADPEAEVLDKNK